VISIWWALAAFMAGGCGGILLISLMRMSAEDSQRPALISDTPPLARNRRTAPPAPTGYLRLSVGDQGLRRRT
jgi:hypothetical protein